VTKNNRIVDNPWHLCYTRFNAMDTVYFYKAVFFTICRLTHEQSFVIFCTPSLPTGAKCYDLFMMTEVF
jgi:hypothetical protein